MDNKFINFYGKLGFSELCLFPHHSRTSSKLQRPPIVWIWILPSCFGVWTRICLARLAWQTTKSIKVKIWQHLKGNPKLGLIEFEDKYFSFSSPDRAEQVCSKEINKRFYDFGFSMSIIESLPYKIMSLFHLPVTFFEWLLYVSLCYLN